MTKKSPWFRDVWRTGAALDGNSLSSEAQSRNLKKPRQTNAGG